MECKMANENGIAILYCSDRGCDASAYRLKARVKANIGEVTVIREYAI